MTGQYLLARVQSSNKRTPKVQYDIFIDVNNRVCCTCGWFTKSPASAGQCKHIDQFKAKLPERSV